MEVAVITVCLRTQNNSYNGGIGKGVRISKQTKDWLEF
jgi:hypothetical protein